MNTVHWQILSLLYPSSLNAIFVYYLQPSTQHRQNVDQLQAQVDHLKAELGLAE